MPEVSRRYWFTFPTRNEVEQPLIWQMSRKYPDVIFDIRQSTVKNDQGVMAVLLTGEEDEVEAAVKFLRGKGLQIDPIEKNIVEG